MQGAGLLLAACCGPAFAQALDAAPAPGTADACVAIEVDADRLACYDAALGRARRDTRAADIAAQEARAIRENLALGDAIAGGRDGRPASDLYAQDAPLETAEANAGKGSMLDGRWELAKDSKLGTFNFRAYKPVYLLPVFWTSRQNALPHSPNPRNTVAAPQALTDVESKFQLSFKTKALENLFGDNGDVWMAYTQSSRWQVFNGDASRPFRETNYEPEVMLVFRTHYRLGGWSGRLLGVAIDHQSNGRADPLSRSWNRVVASVGLDRGDWALMLRPWWRISDGNDDDNPDIGDYAGRADATLVRRQGRHEFSLMARHSLRSGAASHGAVQFDWGFPISRALRGHLQLFDGYGESLIDYNHRATYIGLGVSLMEWY